VDQGSGEVLSPLVVKARLRRDRRSRGGIRGKIYPAIAKIQLIFVFGGTSAIGDSRGTVSHRRHIIPELSVARSTSYVVIITSDSFIIRVAFLGIWLWTASLFGERSADLELYYLGQLRREYG